MDIRDYTKEEAKYFLGEVRYVNNLSQVKNNSLLGLAVRKAVFAKVPESDLVVCLDMVDTEEKALMADMALKKDRDDERFVYSTTVPNQTGHFFVVTQKNQKFSDNQVNLVTNFKRMIKSIPEEDYIQGFYH